MLVVDREVRGGGIGTFLSHCLFQAMFSKYGAREIFLETEESNHQAMRLYHKMGFVRDEKFRKYYLNGSDAFRLRLWLDDGRWKEIDQEMK